MTLTLIALLAAAAAPQTEPEPRAYEPTTKYVATDVEGWKVYVHERLVSDDETERATRATGDEALRLLREKLVEIRAVVPDDPLKKIQQVPIWLEVDNTKHNPCACYHVDEGWLKNAGFNPEKVRCVEISSAATFIQWLPSQPMMVLHELAHGYHHRELTYQYEPIIELHRAAKKSGAYDAVRRFHAEGELVRHYALNTPMEYFAEATEAYFGRNDYYPFVREELVRHDPACFELMKSIWGKPKK